VKPQIEDYQQKNELIKNRIVKMNSAQYLSKNIIGAAFDRMILPE
jgi:hypothetical protein